VFLVGESRRPVGRKGASPGNLVSVSGTLGDSRAGLELVLMNRTDYENFEQRLMEKHLKPVVRTDMGPYLSAYASAGMDISDGLVADAYHLARRSGVRIDIDSSALPISEDLRAFCEKYGRNPLDYALYGGEDYCILFTHEPSVSLPAGVSVVGRVSEGFGVWVDGREAEPRGCASRA